MAFLPTQDQLDKAQANDDTLGIPRGTTARQIGVESEWNPNAVSNKGARGYVQVMPDTLLAVQARVGRALNPSDFDDALTLHREVMSENLRQFGNLPDALRAYSAGWRRDRWNNDETNAYVPKVLGGEAPAPVSGKQTKVGQKLAMAQAASGLFRQMADGTVGERSVLDQVTGSGDTSLTAKAEQSSWAQVADQTTKHVDPREAFVQAAVWGGITGRLKDIFSREADDPNWTITPDQSRAMGEQTPQVWANDDLRNYVLGSGSEAEWRRRMGWAIERAEFENRAAAVQGWEKVGATTAQLAAGMGDPAVILATMGTGGAVAAARSAIAARAGVQMSSGLLGSAALAGAENGAIEMAIRASNNQDMDWSGVLQQSIVGAALGAGGHLLANRFGGAPVPKNDPAVVGAAKAATEVAERGVREAGALDVRGPVPNGGVYAADPVAMLSEFRPHRVGMTDVVEPGARRLADVLDADVAALEAERTQHLATAAKGADKGAIASARDELGVLAGSVPDEADVKALTRNYQAGGMKFKEAQAKATADVQAYTAEHHAKVERLSQFIEMNAEAAKSHQRLTEIETQLAALRRERASIDAPQTAQLPMATAVRRALASMTDEAIPTIRREERALSQNTEAAVAGASGKAELARMAAGTADPMVQGLAGRLHEQLRGDVSVVRRADDSVTGAYNPKTHSVSLGGKAGDDVLLHELAHAATVKKLEYGKANPASAHGKIAGELEKLRAEAAAAYRGNDSKTRYYLSNVDEFVAGLYSGKTEFIDHLAAMKSKGEHLLTKAVDLVRSLLGITANQTNALLKAIGLADTLIDTPLHDTAAAGVRNSAPVRDDIVRSALAQEFKKQIDDWQEVRPEATAKLRERAAGWYGSAVRDTAAFRMFGQIADSVGLLLAQSKSKGVRMWASALGEDATGMNRQHASSAAIEKEIMTHSFKRPFFEVHERIWPKLFTPKELAAAAMGGGEEAQKRVGKLIAEERLKHRAAVQAGTEYVSTADPLVREYAGALDGYWRTLTENGKAVGDAQSEGIHGGGWVGYMPYKWDFRALNDLYVNDVPKFNAFKAILRRQYEAKVVGPALDKMLATGPHTPEALAELRTTASEKAGRMVDHYLNQTMKDPQSRIDGADNHFGAVAADLLLEDWRGTKVSWEMATEFKQRLTDVIKDRTRTEFDLLDAEGGVRMLDYIDTDIGRMVNGSAAKWSGNIALAKRGLRDPQHVDALLDALRQDGATPQDVDNIHFLIRSLQGNLNNQEHGVSKLLQTGAYVTMMGKLGFNAMADIATIASTVGVGGFFRSLYAGVTDGAGKGLKATLHEYAGSALGLDHRMHIDQTTNSVLKPETVLAEGSTLNRLADRSANAVGTLSGLNLVGKIVHRGVLPILAEDMWAKIRDGKGHITDARLADMGILPQDIDRIRTQMTKHDGGRKKGDGINFDKWDDQYAADAFIGSLHRATWQVVQRALVGETPRWATEKEFGKLIGQFRRFGVTAAEKQFARNVFIGDSNAAVGFTMATAWGAMLYYAKVQANTVGMDSTQKQKYLEENLSGMKLATGVAVMVNMAGLLPDTLDLGHTIFGGQTFGSSSPVAAIGFLQNIGRGAGAAGNVASGAVLGHMPGKVDPVDYHKQLRNMWRLVPGSNTVFGTALSNSLATQ
ncbi:hypothetical protein AB870_03520 [Pandoraea faecigallinarum]|uniref:Transglycosylase SLT domain-containing protein n=1 Tax=Pandoraea faecigallinarum TaxID=656179 RepID=A0A0H3WS54_9BURK|nr:transglycosylase SLT domain-containing protein [Pandoraea faecigallinarum]AKM29403.1 hypothetical protein AB870_03520 [Pandoraea faecigallinarum]